MNKLLRSPIAAKTQGVPFPGARRAVEHASASPTPYRLFQFHFQTTRHAIGSTEAQTLSTPLLLPCVKEGDLLVGSINLTLEPDHEQAELGFWFGVVYWRRGYATESARALLAYAFGQLALDRVHAHHMLRNPASGAVLCKIGMQSEGVQRLRIKKKRTFEDVAIYAVLRHEFAGDQATTNQEKVNDTLGTPAPHLGRPRGTARR